MNVKGDQLGPDGKELAESLEIWARDPVDCIKEILGNPSFKDKVSYSPRKEYIDPEMRQRVYTEMATADWWWKVQVRWTCLLSHSRGSPAVISGEAS